jgi:hypothetical protein
MRIVCIMCSVCIDFSWHKPTGCGRCDRGSIIRFIDILCRKKTVCTNMQLTILGPLFLSLALSNVQRAQHASLPGGLLDQ